MKIYQKSLTELEQIVQNKTRQLTDPKVEQAVSQIIEQVAENGDTAVRNYEEKFDQVKLTDFKLDQAVIDEAYETLDENVKQALLLAKKNITSFHQKKSARVSSIQSRSVFCEVKNYCLWKRLAYTFLVVLLLILQQF
jgi:Histidinol dehydrogenase